MSAWTLLYAICTLAAAGEPLRLEPLAEPITAGSPASLPPPTALTAAALTPPILQAPSLPLGGLPAVVDAGSTQSSTLPSKPLATAMTAASRQPRAAEAQSAEASARFDNAYLPKAEVVAALGFDPVGRAGGLLSLPTKDDVRVLQVAKPDGSGSIVVKVADRQAIARELFVRNVVAETPLFNAHLEIIPARAFRRRLFDPRVVMVMERKDLRRTSDLSIQHRAALAALAYGLGISDHNEDGVFAGSNGKTLINDFEKALVPLREDMAAGALSDPALHLGRTHLNDYADYAPAVDAWRRHLAENEDAVIQSMRRSGMSDGEALRALNVLKRNAALMEGQLKKDLARDNDSFMNAAAGAGLTPRQARALSGVNRAARLGDASMRDAVRRFVRERGKNASRWKLWPERGDLTPAEWKDYLDSRADKSDSDRS